jgi:hypothetical protein
VMNELLKLTFGKTIANIIPVLSEISNDVVKLQIIFTDDSELNVMVDESSLDWRIK